MPTAHDQDLSLPCIICREPLQKVDSGAQNHPEDGVACFTRGNYGSTVFDPNPLSGTFLEFNICDLCLAEAGRSSRMAIGYHGLPLRLWDGKE